MASTLARNQYRNSRLGFTDLPPEIRFMIYNSIGPTKQGFDYNDWTGLYSSCRMIKHEMDTECTKSFLTVLRSFSNHDCIFAIELAYFNGSKYIHTLTKFSQLQHIKLTLHIDLERYLNHQWLTIPRFGVVVVGGVKFYKYELGTAFKEILCPLLPWAITEIVCKFRRSRFEPKPVDWSCAKAASFAVSTLFFMERQLWLGKKMQRSFVNRRLRGIMVDVDCQRMGVDVRLLNRVCMETKYYRYPVSWVEGGDELVCIAEKIMVPSVHETNLTTVMDRKTKDNIRRLDKFCAARSLGRGRKRSFSVVSDS